MNRLVASLALTAGLALSVGGAGLTLVDAVKAGNRDAVHKILSTPAGKSAVNAGEADGTTSLHWATRADDLETAKLLLAAGANANAVNRYGVTPLSLAAGNANAELVDVLLKAGADAKTVIKDGETVLMAAARTGSPRAVQMLSEYGAVVDPPESQLGGTG